MSAPAAPGRDAPLTDAEIADAFAGLEGAAGPILAAVSGGPDSTALMGTLADWSAGRERPAIHVATVDHGLRPASRGEAEAVAAAAASLGFEHAILTWAGQGGGPVSQAAAREARYGLLARHAGAIRATHLITAHTLDDQAETVLLRLAAGSGLSGLAGMRRETARGPIQHIRPFLHLPKSRLVATCRARGWAYVEDPSNTDSRFARARWRELTEHLAAEGLDADRLARLAERLARADGALDEIARGTFARLARRDNAGVEIDMAALALAPAEITLRVLALALQPDDLAVTTHLRLERLEGCAEAVRAALREGASLRRTLAGFVLHLGRDGRLRIVPETPRRRGRGMVTPIPNGTSPSLGMEPDRA